MSRILCLVPSAELFQPEKSSFQDIYKVSNSCARRVAEAGGIPVGLAPVDGWVPEEVLSLFDGYLVQGGAAFFPYHYQVIHDAVTHGKRYLGLCLGEQLIHSYFTLRRLAEEEGHTGDPVRAIWALKTDPARKIETLEPVAGHRAPPLIRGREEASKHPIDIVPGTILHRLLGRKTVWGATYHDLRIPAGTTLTVNAWAADGSGTVEGVEWAPNLLGVQFHPEVDEAMPELFTFLTEE